MDEGGERQREEEHHEDLTEPASPQLREIARHSVMSGVDVESHRTRKRKPSTRTRA